MLKFIKELLIFLEYINQFINNMKKIIFTLLFALSISAMFSQTLITGTVKDNNGVPVTGANIILLGTTSGSTSDFDGKFSFTSSLSGSQTLQVTYLGYTTYEQELNLDGSQITLDIILQEGGSTLNEVLLTATAITRSKKESPLSISSFKASGAC
jgi:iron complex outermembrane receptor protein